MTQRKKYLYAGLALNLLFYTGVSLALATYSIKDAESFLHNQLRQFLQLEEMMLWEKQITAKNILKVFYEKKMPPSNLSYLSGFVGVTAITKKVDGKLVPVIPNQPTPPIPETIFDSQKPVGVFHSVENTLMYLTFLITAREVPGLPAPHIVTIEQPLLALPSTSPLLKSDITILEQSWSGVQVLRSTFSRELRNEVKKQFLFDTNLPTASQINFQEREVFHQTMMLDNEKYLVYPVYLINQKNFSQVVLYTFKIKDFVVVNNFGAAIAVLLMLCISSGIIFTAYHWSRSENEA